MKRVNYLLYFLGSGLLIIILTGCGASVLPEEAAQVVTTHTPPPEGPVTVVPLPTETLTPCGYAPTPDPASATLLSQAPTPPTPTPLPSRGVRVGEVSRVTPATISLAGQGEICLDHIYNFDLEGDTLVGVAPVVGGRVVIAFDLETKEIRQLSQRLSENPASLLISGRYVVWVEQGPDLGESINRLQLFDLDQNHIETVWEGSFFHLDFKGHLIIWQEHRGQGWSLYGYDLKKREGFTIVEGPLIQSYPHICSDDWLIYLQSEMDKPGPADLYAYHLPSREAVLIGQVPLFRDATAGRQHKCDGPYVAWVSNVKEQATLQQWNPATEQIETYSTETYRQHLYDLRNRTDRTLETPPGLPIEVKLAGDILVGTTGYDLQRDAPFKLYPPDLPPDQRPPVTLLALSKGRLVWKSAPYTGPEHLFTAFVIRD